MAELRPALTTAPYSGWIVEQNSQIHRLLCCAGPYFALERWKLTTQYDYAFTGARLLSNLGEPLILEAEGVDYSLGRAESIMLPAALAHITIHGPGELLIGYLPHLHRDIIEPLTKQGFNQQTRDRLGDVMDRFR